MEFRGYDTYLKSSQTFFLKYTNIIIIVCISDRR